MNITKIKLKEIILEELSAVLNEEEAQEEAQPEAAPLASSAAGKDQQSDTGKVLTYIDKIDNKIELAQVVSSIVGHSKNVAGSREVLMKLYKQLPALIKQAQ